MTAASATSRPRPYVGISGVISPGQQASLTATAETLGLFARRRLLLGVKAVHKTQYLDVENKYGPDWYPVGESPFATALRPAATSETNIIGTAQLYLDVDHVAVPAYRTAFVGRVIDRGRQWLQALQFDLLPWHTSRDIIDFLADLRAGHPGLEILIQCHGPAMTRLGPSGVAQALVDLAPYIDHVLFDSSHGTGRTLDIAALFPFLEQAYASDELARVGFGVAGGLDAHALRAHLPVLLDTFPDLSWDAEGRMRGDDPARPGLLSPTLPAGYLAASAAALTDAAAQRR